MQPVTRGEQQWERGQVSCAAPGAGSVWINREITPEQRSLQISSAKTIK